MGSMAVGVDTDFFVLHMHLPINPPLPKLGTGTGEPVAEAGAFVFLRYFNYCGITMTKELFYDCMVNVDFISQKALLVRPHIFLLYLVHSLSVDPPCKLNL